MIIAEYHLLRVQIVCNFDPIIKRIDDIVFLGTYILEEPLPVDS